MGIQQRESVHSDTLLFLLYLTAMLFPTGCLGEIYLTVPWSYTGQLASYMGDIATSIKEYGFLSTYGTPVFVKRAGILCNRAWKSGIIPFLYSKIIFLCSLDDLSVTILFFRGNTEYNGTSLWEWVWKQHMSKKETMERELWRIDRHYSITKWPFTRLPRNWWRQHWQEEIKTIMEGMIQVL